MIAGAGRRALDANGGASAGHDCERCPGERPARTISVRPAHPHGFELRQAELPELALELLFEAWAAVHSGAAAAVRGASNVHPAARPSPRPS